jgi:hypothetical protein
MKKATNKLFEKYYAEIGKAVCDAFVKQFSHPYVKIDMCPEFSNLLILTYGRFIYKFLNSRKGRKLWEKLDDDYKKELRG